MSSRTVIWRKAFDRSAMLECFLLGKIKSEDLSIAHQRSHSEGSQDTSEGSNDDYHHS